MKGKPIQRPQTLISFQSISLRLTYYCPWGFDTYFNCKFPLMVKYKHKDKARLVTLLPWFSCIASRYVIEDLNLGGRWYTVSIKDLRTKCRCHKTTPKNPLEKCSSQPQSPNP